MVTGRFSGHSWCMHAPGTLAPQPPAIHAPPPATHSAFGQTDACENITLL